jgi:hypothetical protein
MAREAVTCVGICLTAGALRFDRAIDRVTTVRRVEPS